MTFDPYKIADFLKAHKLMTQGLVKAAGKFRSSDVGVFDGDVAVHIGARPQFVPELMSDLFAWAKASDLHPVLKSAILHYEIETVHPFADGNGRMGRLWQTLLLAKWNAIFAWIPMESVIYQNRPEYYDALYYSQHSGDSDRFIEFTLFSLLETLKKMYSDSRSTEQDKKDLDGDLDGATNQDTVQDARAKAILEFCSEPRSRDGIQQYIGVSNRGYFRTSILKPMLESGKLKMTIPDKPNSRNQKYVRA
jgi:Fic family protein